MLVKQISVFLENKEGRLAEVTEILAQSGINISALTIADTSTFGILRLIVEDPSKTESLLKSKGFSVSLTDVIAVDIDDRPGGLSKPLSMLFKNGISVEYIYAFISKKENTAHVVLKVNDINHAVDILEVNGYEYTGK